jgi:hypothetical protein
VWDRRHVKPDRTFVGDRVGPDVGGVAGEGAYVGRFHVHGVNLSGASVQGATEHQGPVVTEKRELVNGPGRLVQTVAREGNGQDRVVPAARGDSCRLDIDDENRMQIDATV